MSIRKKKEPIQHNFTNLITVFQFLKRINFLINSVEEVIENGF